MMKMAGARRSLRLQFGRWWLPIPRILWRRMVSNEAGVRRREVASLEPEHHSVRDFVVLEIAKTGQPVAADTIASRLGMPFVDVTHILDELESKKTYLFRNPMGEVEWAYPVTARRTPHRATLSSGEQSWAA